MLHQILEGFFSGDLGNRSLLAPLPGRLQKASFGEFGAQRLKVLTDAVLPAQIEFAPLKTHLERFAWPRFLNFVCRQAQSSSCGKWLEMPQKRYLEWPLGRGQGVMVSCKELGFKDREHQNILIRGCLDRLDRWPESYTLIDYKRKFIPKPKDVQEGLAPQLSLYALALARDPFLGGNFPLEQGRLVYWSILEGQEVVVAVGDIFQENGGAKKAASQKIPKPVDLIAALKARWGSRAQDHLEASKPFEPEIGKGCTFCTFAGVCRRDDPRTPRIPKKAT